MAQPSTRDLLRAIQENTKALRQLKLFLQTRVQHGNFAEHVSSGASKKPQAAEDTIVVVGPLAINLSQRVVLAHNKTSDPISRKRFDVLVYLALRQGRWVSVETLAEEFWSGSHLDAPLENVKQAVFNVRNILNSVGCRDMLESEGTTPRMHRIVVKEV